MNWIRLQELMETGAEEIAVSCPFCTSMLEDAVASSGMEESVKVRDITEFLLLGVEDLS